MSCMTMSLPAVASPWHPVGPGKLQLPFPNLKRCSLFLVSLRMFHALMRAGDEEAAAGGQREGRYGCER